MKNLSSPGSPILKALPDEDRERARELIEKYGETNPTNFIVELLEVFGIHAAYLQTVPAQVTIAGERAKADVTRSLDAVTILHERTRLELNDLVSSISRSGAGFTKALEAATAAHVTATGSSVGELKAKIQQEFVTQNLPALTTCLGDIQEKAASIPLAERVHEDAERIEEYAQRRLDLAERHCNVSLDKLENSIGAGLVRLDSLFHRHTGSCRIRHTAFFVRVPRKLADEIALASATIGQNKDAFDVLAVANIRLRIQRSSDARTGNLIPSGFAILVENAEDADMRDFGGGKAGCVFVKSPSPEEELIISRFECKEF